MSKIDRIPHYEPAPKTPMQKLLWQQHSKPQTEDPKTTLHRDIEQIRKERAEINRRNGMG